MALPVNVDLAVQQDTHGLCTERCPELGVIFGVKMGPGHTAVSAVLSLVWPTAQTSADHRSR